MKYYIVAGEASGDLHASNLMKSLKQVDKEADFRFFGGDLMQSTGGSLVKHYRELAYMGLIPVLLHLKTILRNLDLCKKDILAYNPDALILVDYPGFNLKIARYVKEQTAIPVFYYISPKIWAWKGWRIKDIRKHVDKMLCILPFEVSFYQRHSYPVTYVGNPTVDAITGRECAGETFEAFTQRNQLSRRPIIALLPGSRKQEIKNNLPSMLRAASVFTDFQLVIGGAPGIAPDFYKRYSEIHPAGIVFEQTYRLLQQAQAALVTSGTATLETALLQVPQIVCYKTTPKRLSGFVWNHFFKVKYISLVNLIANQPVVRELFNENFSVQNIRNELNRLLYEPQSIDLQQAGYRKVIDTLGSPGASERAAKAIFDFTHSHLASTATLSPEVCDTNSGA